MIYRYGLNGSASDAEDETRWAEAEAQIRAQAAASANGVSKSTVVSIKAPSKRKAAEDENTEENTGDQGKTKTAKKDGKAGKKQKRDDGGREKKPKQKHHDR